MQELGIVYKCYKIREGLYVLDPKKIIEGYTVGEDFYYENETPLKTIDSLKKGNQEFVIDGITQYEVLMDFYDEFEDEDLVRDFYYAEQDDFLVVVQIKNGELVKRKIKRDAIFNSKEIEIYDMSEAEPFALIDSSTINRLQEERDINAIRKTLDRVQKRLISSSKTKDGDRIKSVRIENEEITDIKVNTKGIKIVNNGTTIEAPRQAPQIVTSTSSTPLIPTFTLKGLEDYLKERIFGHDAALKKIATIVYSNYKAQDTDTIESILIPGPTGTGKTETARLICKYLGVPYKEIDCSTLVPEGIVGTRLGDELRDYVIECAYDATKAQKGILILDEFDKIALTGLDIKAAARFELLKFIEGKKYTIERKGTNTPVIIDTSRIMKFFLGAFGDAIVTRNPMGFQSTPINTVEDMEKKIIDNTRFERELLSRIQYTIPYANLTPEDKKRIILYSKNSIYAEKKRRLERDYNVTVLGDELFAESVLEAINADKEGIRQMNNIISSALLDVFYELGTNEGKYKRLVLTKDTVSKGKFDLS